MLNLGTEGHTQTGPYPALPQENENEQPRIFENGNPEDKASRRNEQPRIFENGNPEDKADNLFESYRQTGLDDDYRRYTIALRQLGIATQQYHKLAEMAE